jgi:hypothetical protein
MDLAAVVLALAAPLLAGAAIAAAAGLRPAADPLAGAAWASLAGALAAGAVLTACLALGLPLSAWTVNAALAGIAALFAILAWRRRGPAAAPLQRAAAPAWQNGIFSAVVVLLVALACDRMLLAAKTPIVGDDEAFIWSARAKVLFRAGTFDAAFRGETAESTPAAPDVVAHKDYPLLDSLLHLLVFVDAGRVTHVENRIPIQVFGVAAILLMASALRRTAGPLAGAALLVAWQSEWGTRDAARTGMADGMVAFGLAAAIDCLLREDESGARAWSRLGGLALAFLAWSKHEGAVLAALTGAAAVAQALRSERGGRLARAAAWLVPPAAAVAITWAINARFGFRNDLVHAGGPPWVRFVEGLPARGPAVLGAFWREWAIAADASRLMAFPLVLAFVPRLVRVPRSVVLAAAVVVAAILVHLAVFVATPNDLAQHWETAGLRVLGQLGPAIALVVGAVAGAAFRTAWCPTRSTRADPPRR